MGRHRSGHRLVTLYFVTGNAGKFREVQALIPEVEQLKLDLDEIQDLDPRVVIEHKLGQAAHHHDGRFIVEDTSLTLNCLGGLPGTLIKWFEQTISLPGIAELAHHYPDHTAVARTFIGYRDAAGQDHFVSGEITGTIVAPRGHTGIGWDFIFVPQGHTQTFAELGPAVKNTMSMRQQAVQQLQALLDRPSA
jgi:non-canonical purine NTP pyrophosphatase (RdgB/HAM1 family)